MSDHEPKSMEYRISAPARLQVMRLNDKERRQLAELLASPEQARRTGTHRTATGHFVSRISPTKRVLWTNRDDVPTVLSIVDKSYSATG